METLWRASKKPSACPRRIGEADFYNSWQVRLIACIGLIDQKTADERVVATLEALSQEPEAVEHDAAPETFGDLWPACDADGSNFAWDKMSDLIAKSRTLAARDRKGGTTSER